MRGDSLCTSRPRALRKAGRIRYLLVSAGLRILTLNHRSHFPRRPTRKRARENPTINEPMADCEQLRSTANMDGCVYRYGWDWQSDSRRFIENLGTEPRREMQSVTTSPNSKAHYHRRLRLYPPSYLRGQPADRTRDDFPFGGVSPNAVLAGFFCFASRHYHSRRRRVPQRKTRRGVDLYCDLVPKYIPLALPGRGFSFGRHFPLSELGTAFGILLAGLLVEWLESPPAL
jgi:hypothetical protein